MSVFVAVYLPGELKQLLDQKLDCDLFYSDM